MMNKRNLICLIALITVSLAGVSTAAAKTAKLNGRTLFKIKKCSRCHAVSSAKIQAKVTRGKSAGGDLTGVSKKYSSQQLTGYIGGKLRLGGKLHSRGFKGTDEELQALVDWLLEQK